MGESIVITSGKGGVGKTTTTANLGTGLAKMGKKVCLVDADIGLRNLDVVMGLENRIVFDIVDVVEGHCKIKNALIKDKRIEGLYLLPAAQTRDKTSVLPDQMIALILELKSEFDYVLIDSPAGIEHGFKNAIVAADKALVVTVPEVSAVRDADRIIGLLMAHEVPFIKLIINRLKKELLDSGDMLGIDDTLEILSIDLMGIVPDDESIMRSSNVGEPVVIAGVSPAGIAYSNIVRRLLGQEVPLMELKSDSSFMSKFKKLFSK